MSAPDVQPELEADQERERDPEPPTTAAIVKGERVIYTHGAIMGFEFLGMFV